MMRYNIDSVIKRLQEVQSRGKTLVKEEELIRIATPQVNDIDRQIKHIERGIEKKEEQTKKDDIDLAIILRVRGIITFTEAESLTGIPRRTFYRWKNEGIVQCYRLRQSQGLSLRELKETMLRIKQIKG